MFVTTIISYSLPLSHSKLKTIQELLFSKGQRGIQPKDMPLNIFVKLIHFISRVRVH